MSEPRGARRRNPIYKGLTHLMGSTGLTEVTPIRRLVESGFAKQQPVVTPEPILAWLLQVGTRLASSQPTWLGVELS